MGKKGTMGTSVNETSEEVLPIEADSKKPSESIFALVVDYGARPWVMWAIIGTLCAFLLWMVSHVKATESRLEAQSDRITRMQAEIRTIAEKSNFRIQVDSLTDRVGMMEESLEEMAELIKAKQK